MTDKFSRFLIASAMQTFTTQSLSYQSQSSTSPFSSPMLLASLLVPQLEIYLANNISTRLLIIHYSSSHLPTILALRHLVGADTLKIVGILDSSNPLSKNAASNPSRPVGNRLSNANVAALNDRTRLSSRSSGRSTRNHSPNQSIEFKHNSSEPRSTSFLRANYLLPSTATDVEIATFLSNITDHLIEKSSYYTPEPTLYSPRKLSSPLSPSFPPTANSTSGPRKPKNSEVTPNGNSNRQRAQSRGEKDSRVGQSINTNIFRSQSSQGNYATPIKGTFASNGQSFNTPDSTTHLTTPSITSISSSTASNPTRPYSRDSTSHTPFPNSNSTSTILNSSSYSNSTLHNNIQIPNIPQTMHTQLPLPPPLPINLITRPSTAEVRERQSEHDWANFYFGESDEEDEMDRILMPKVPRRIERRKGSSKKALKFLGLG